VQAGRYSAAGSSSDIRHKLRKNKTGAHSRQPQLNPPLRNFSKYRDIIEVTIKPQTTMSVDAKERKPTNV
jgi:hypothetical protein